MEQQKYKITKTNVECYKLRLPGGDYWADITLDSGENAGRLSISSDYGHWANYWGACGKGFKEFLISLNIDYVASKIGESRYFDAPGTIKVYKEHILESRRSASIDAGDARNCFKEIKELESGSNDRNQFFHSMQDCDNLMKYFDYCPDSVECISPLFTRFWYGPWQAFIAELKKEISISVNPSL